MFYGENEIINILNCSKCKEKLDEPKILPCGVTVCSICLRSIHVNNKKFKCIVCNDDHVMPENGLPFNIAVQALLSIQPKEVYRSLAVETLKKTLEAVLKNKNLLQNACSNSIERIKELCIETRNEAQLASEQVIKQINDLNDHFIKEINQYQLETIKSYQSNKVDKEKIMTTINELDSFHSKWTEYLKQIKINDETILEANNEALRFNEKAIQELTNLDYFIFNKGLIKFTKNSNNKLEKSLLGSLNIQCLNFFFFKSL